MHKADQDYDRVIAPLEGQMIRAVWGITQNPEDAEDAFQEALAKIWRQWSRVCRHPNPRALILRICVNCAYDILRKNSRRRRREILAALKPAKAARRPDEHAAAQEDTSAVMRAIAQLSRHQAVAVTMRLVQGEPYSAIAQILGCTDVTARKHVARGRARLQQTLAGLAPKPPEESQS